MTRTEMREEAFKLLYSLEIQKENINEQIDLFIENNKIQNKKAIEYIKDAILGIENNKSEILEYINRNLKQDWTLDRISISNLAILKLAIYEIIYKKIPYKAGIDEAVKIGKKYGEESSKVFVNGILASLIRELGLEEN